MTKNPELKGAQISRTAVVRRIQRRMKQLDQDSDAWVELYGLLKWIHEMPARYNKRPGGLGRMKKAPCHKVKRLM